MFLHLIAIAQGIAQLVPWQAGAKLKILGLLWDRSGFLKIAQKIIKIAQKSLNFAKKYPKTYLFFARE